MLLEHKTQDSIAPEEICKVNFFTVRLIFCKIVYCKVDLKLTLEN